MGKIFEVRGFSLIETLIVVGVIGIISIVVFSNLFTRSNRAALDSTVLQMVATLREAQSRSAAGENSAAWGVRFDNTTGTAPFYALFRTSYTSQNTAGYYRLPPDVNYATSSIAQGSSVEITFSKISGIPSATSSITLNLTRGVATGAVATSATITVNSTGLISF
ncbi:MAG: prepilin-type N-terminal cleavage/methylation domain-containing protein [Candidatus Liptonbacteria bacterium]|nr:prepilin-type N-terminal cleavage/methylation domain-containing protein [Candidatus Liptonbacteria bacterium]